MRLNVAELKVDINEPVKVNDTPFVNFWSNPGSLSGFKRRHQLTLFQFSYYLLKFNQVKKIFSFVCASIYLRGLSRYLIMLV